MEEHQVIESPEYQQNASEADNNTIEEVDTPQPEQAKTYVSSNQIQGIVPKQMDEHERAQMMGFIAYAQNLESTIKLVTFNKSLNLNEPHDKNRIFVTGNAIMSAKLSTSQAAQQKICNQLQNTTMYIEKIKRSNVMDRTKRQQAMKLMRDSLQVTTDLQSRYIDLNEFKKVACVDLEKAFPIQQESDDEDANPGEEPSPQKTNPKKRKMTNSFYNANNLVQWEENPKSPNFQLLKPSNIYWFKSALYDFENRDRKFVVQSMKVIVKPDIDTVSLINSRSRPNVGWSSYNSTTPNIEQTPADEKKGNSTNPKKQKNGNMDLMKKFRYNFHYWLKNCYQPENQDQSDHNKEIYQTQMASNHAANQIFQMAKNNNLSTLTPEQCLLQQKFLKKCPNCDQENRICEVCIHKTLKYQSQTQQMRSNSNLQTKANSLGVENLPKKQKYMVIQMGQSEDELQDQMLIKFLSQNALAIKHHPGAVQFQVSKQMLQTLKKKFSNMKAMVPREQLQQHQVQQSLNTTESMETKKMLDQSLDEKKNFFQTPQIHHNIGHNEMLKDFHNSTGAQSRYSSRGRVNLTSNKASNLNSTYELKSQQQFINQISQHAGKSKTNLERTLVASREIRNRQTVNQEMERPIQIQQKFNRPILQNATQQRVNEAVANFNGAKEIHNQKYNLDRFESLRQKGYFETVQPQEQRTLSKQSGVLSRKTMGQIAVGKMQQQQRQQLLKSMNTAEHSTNNTIPVSPIQKTKANSVFPNDKARIVHKSSHLKVKQSPFQRRGDNMVRTLENCANGGGI